MPIFPPGPGGKGSPNGKARILSSKVEDPTPRTFLATSLRLSLIGALLLIAACSASQSNVRQSAESTDRSSANGVKLAIDVTQLQTSSQEGGGLFTLHASRAEVQAIAERIAGFYGFEPVPEAEASFKLDIKRAVPDGGACTEGVEAAEVNVSYTLSLLTLGAFPATKFYCMLVVVDLYDTRTGQTFEMGEFFSNKGLVEAYAGINTLKSYRRSVDRAEEVKGLESSFGEIMSEIINEGAFVRF